MPVSDILRKLADIVDQTEQSVAPTQEPAGDEEAEIEVTQLEPVDVSDEDGSECASMVSPQQQELELLKKSQGMENHVEDFAEEDCSEEEEDELEAMKRMAGIGEQDGPVDHGDSIRENPMHVNPKAEAAKEFHKSRNDESE